MKLRKITYNNGHCSYSTGTVSIKMDRAKAIKEEEFDITDDEHNELLRQPKFISFDIAKNGKGYILTKRKGYKSNMGSRGKRKLVNKQSPE